MGRLTQIKPRLAPPPRRLAAPLGADRDGPRGRDATLAWRKWYKTARWQRLRWDVLVRDGFQCQRCRRVEPDSARLVADHVRAHRGDAALFWDPGNLQCLCRTCHDGAKQAEERAGGGG